MEVDRNEEIGSLLSRLTNCSQEEALNIILELDILAGTNAADFKQEFVRNEFGRLLALLRTLKGKAKDHGFTLASKVFHILGPTEIIAKNIHTVTAMLAEGDEELKLFYLKQLAVSTATLEGASFMLRNIQEAGNSVLEAVVRNIGHELLSVAKNASIVMYNVLKFQHGISNFLADNGIQLFTELLSKSALVRFRVYQLFADLLVEDSELIRNKQVQHILHILVLELQNDDILTQVNCLEMLSTIATSSFSCLDFLAKSGTLHQLNTVFKDVEDDPLKQILLPGTIKFFGKTATEMPEEILLHYPEFVNFVFKCCNEGDAMLKVLCFETIFAICSTDGGLKILYQNPERLNHAMAILGRDVISSMDEALKVRLIDALAHLFAISEANCSEESFQIRETLYQHIDKQPINTIMTCAKLPFQNIRLSALGALANIAAFSWSEQDMALTPGFLEYMLDRRTEHDKEGKELKYKILKTISKSITAKENIGMDYYERICNYVEEGPFYSEQQIAVDFEKM